MRFFETKDYDNFVFMEGNRAITPSNVKRFIDIIKNDELHDEIQVNPRQVDGKWVIVDGQHRFLAHRELGLPVPVLMKRKNVPLTGVIQINTTRKNWSVLDRVKSYATLGNENYKRLLTMYNELNAIHPVSVNLVSKLCRGSLGTSIKAGEKSNINDGSWVFLKKEQDVRKVFNECLKFTKQHPDVISDTFVHCIQSLMENQPGFQIKRMLTASTIHNHRFIRAARKQDMLRMLEDVYNFNRDRRNRLFFDVNNL